MKFFCQRPSTAESSIMRLVLLTDEWRLKAADIIKEGRWSDECVEWLVAVYLVLQVNDVLRRTKKMRPLLRTTS